MLNKRTSARAERRHRGDHVHLAVGQAELRGTATAKRGATVVNDGWTPHGTPGAQMAAAAAGANWKVNEALVRGLYLVPPGGSFSRAGGEGRRGGRRPAVLLRALARGAAHLAHLTAVKLLELISFRDRDAAEFRRDLLKDIGALRQRCEQLEQKTERLEKELHTVEAENVGLKVEVNTLLGRLGEPAKYPIEVILRPKPTQ
jgi:hypothetical protein